MKILLINKYHFRKGGAERAYFDMAEILEKRGHEVAFFSMEHPKNEPTRWSQYFVSNVDYHNEEASLYQKVTAAIRIIWNTEANRKLAALIDDFQPDIAHAHNIYHQLSPSIFHILKKKNIPIALTLHDYKIVSPNYSLYAGGSIWDYSSGVRCVVDKAIGGSFVKSSICALEKWIHQMLGSYRKVDLLISPSHFLAHKIQELGWQGREVEVVPNPLSEKELAASEDKNHVANQILFFGRLSPEKGVETILEALRGVPQKKLVIVGEGPSKRALEEKVKTLKLEERVTFCGALYGEDLTQKIETAEAVIISSVWYENLPYVVTESLARGAVVIAVASGGIVERIQNGKNGFLYEIGNIKELQKILLQLDLFSLPTIRHNAKKSVADLQPNIFGERLESLYQKIQKN